ncbi:MAG TPA: histidine--tRNA ligase [Thermoplasmata archaeon]|nr:histidine--tRNA ligase [Thermoplasmata archaeon]
MPFEALRGFRDYPPPDAGARSEILRRMRAVARRCGYSELELPSVESSDLYRVKSGGELGEEIWKFTDRGGREVALAPESTPSLARIFADRAKAEPLPVKWFCVEKLWRYEEPQAGRTREFTQFNLDVLGAPGVDAVVDILATAALAMDEVGAAGQYLFRVNDRELAAGLGASLGATDTDLFFRALDRFRKIPRAEFRDQLVASGVRAGTASDWADRLEGARAGLQGTGAEAFFDAVGGAALPRPAHDGVARLRELLGLVQRIGLGDRVVFDPTIVRGLAYYTSTVFEAYPRADDSRALFGGGRYDGLIGLFGGPPTPACGVAIGDITLELLLRAHGTWPEGEPPLDTFVAAVTAEDRAEAFAWVERLRRAGVSATCDLMGRTLSRQLKDAARQRARRALILGPAERAKGVIVERDLATGMQRERTPAEVVPSA